MRLSQIQQLVQPELQEVTLYLSHPETKVGLLAAAASHLGGDGKKLRATLLLLVAKALGYQGTLHIRLALMLEYLHNASLLHDDVIDDAAERRNAAAANKLWGNKASILAGDYLLNCCFTELVACDHQEVMQLLATTIKQVLEGAAWELMESSNLELSVESYLAIAGQKTAALFATAAELAGCLVENGQNQRQSLAAYGYNFGMAFQLRDDLSDVIEDLAEGRVTLPIIFTLQHGSTEPRQLLEAAIAGQPVSADLLAVIQQSGAMAKTEELLQEYTQRALAALAWLPDSPNKSALQKLVLLLVEC